MYLIQGNTHVECNNYQNAIQSFERARARLPYCWPPPPMVVSLASLLTGLNRITHDRIQQMSGWKFDDLHITVRQRLCEALYAGGRKVAARESFLELVNTFGEQVYTTEPKWVSRESILYLLVFCRFDLFYRLYRTMPLRTRKRRQHSPICCNSRY